MGEKLKKIATSAGIIFAIGLLLGLTMQISKYALRDPAYQVLVCHYHDKSDLPTVCKRADALFDEN